MIEIRRYASVEQYRADAAQMAAAGWLPVSQSEGTGSVKAAWLILAGLAALVGAVVWWPGYLGIALFLVAALLDRSRVTVVTYTAKPPEP